MTSDNPTVHDAVVPLVENFDDFYRREYPAMVALATSIAGSHAAGEDLAQEAMVKAHRNWRKIGGYDAPGAWVRRVTINLATSTTRRRVSEFKAKTRLRGGQQNALPPDPGNDHVWAAVATLPPQQRAAIALHYLEDQPVKQIAQILECSESTAKVHLHKARKSLSEILQNETELNDGSPS